MCFAVFISAWNFLDIGSSFWFSLRGKNEPMFEFEMIDDCFHDFENNCFQKKSLHRRIFVQLVHLVPSLVKYRSHTTTLLSREGVQSTGQSVQNPASLIRGHIPHFCIYRKRCNQTFFRAPNMPYGFESFFPQLLIDFYLLFICCSFGNSIGNWIVTGINALL